jgi:hypothetical protein
VLFDRHRHCPPAAEVSLISPLLGVPGAKAGTSTARDMAENKML